MANSTADEQHAAPSYSLSPQDSAAPAVNTPGTPQPEAARASQEAESIKGLKNVSVSRASKPSPLQLAASEALSNQPALPPVFERTGTERIAGSANRLLDNSSRLFVGYGRRPAAPANKKDKQESGPQVSPRIFKVGELEQAAFRAASCPTPPHHNSAAWTAAKNQAHEKHRPERVTSDTQEPHEQSQPSPRSTLPSNPSPDSMLQLLNGRPPSSRTSIGTHLDLKPVPAVSTKSSGNRMASLSRLFKSSAEPTESASVVRAEERHPQTVFKVLRRASDSSLPTEAVSDPQDPAALDQASAVQLRSIQSSPPPETQPARPHPCVRFQSPPLDGAAPPADPQDVLDRPEAPSAEDALDSKLGRSRLARSSTEDSTTLTHVTSERESTTHFVQDRVLVSWGHSRKEHLPADLNETHARRYDIEMESWRECMLVAKGQMLEIYTSHHVANRVRSSHKLLDRIPLEASTTLSLFSPGDYTFMMTCPEQSRRRAVANRLRAGFKPARRLRNLMKQQKQEKQDKGALQGSAIFAIRAQCPSIAQDFYWHIWRALGGSVPTKLEVFLPSLGARFAFKLPQTLDEARQFKPDFPEPTTTSDPLYWSALTPECLVEAARRAVSSVPEWKEIAHHAQCNGLNPVLAWRRGNYLDWIRHEETVTGRPRPWALVAGFAMSEHNFSMKDGLEIRLAAPYPKSVPSLDSVKVEPASIEGPCARLHGVGYRDHIYLFSLGPHLFVIAEQTAAKPAQPGDDQQAIEVKVHRSQGFFQHLGKAFALGKPDREVHRGQMPLEDTSSKASTTDYERGRQFEHEEKDRYLNLVKSARGFLHLCDVQDVQIVNPSEEVQDLQKDSNTLAQLLEQDGEEEGDETLVSVLDINMYKGRQLKIEVIGKKCALQWVYRLRLLAAYWRARTSADAKQQLYFTPDSSDFGRQPLETRCGKEIVKDPSPTGEDAYLNLAFNWSIVTGARGYTLSGVLFTKDERRTQYTRRLCVLIRGHLFFYKLVPLSFSNRPTQQTWHPVKGSWDLTDSYVISQGALCSGWNVATDDPGYKPGESFGPRIYEDGLRNADEDEDCSLAIWKRVGNLDLSKKSKVIILRARSKQERDQWAFALNCEIERLVRLERQSNTGTSES